MDNLGSDGNIALNLKRAAFWLLILAVLGAVLYFVTIFKKEEAQKEYTGLELAKKLEVWAEKSKTKTEGIYVTQRLCKKGDGCKRAKTYNAGGWSTPYGYFDLYRATGDEKYRDTAEAVLERAARRECEEKKMEDCIHYALPAGLLYGYTNDPKYLRFNDVMRPFFDEHIKFHEDIAAGRAKDTHEPQEYAMHAGHVLDFFFLTKDDKYKNAAVKILGDGKRLSDNGNFWLYRCGMLMATVDFYRILREDKYLKEAEALVETYNLREGAGEIVSALDMAFCMESIQLLSEFTGNPAYDDLLKEFMKNLLATFMDHPKNNYYTGNFVVLISPGWREINSKHLGLNMWFMRIFAKIGDSKFSL